MSVPAYLESIILNLITNAVKYGSPSRSTKISLEASKGDKGITFSVKDNGLGIDLERYGDKIFGMYKTFHNNKEARGLGLYIIKNQIEAMDGFITVESAVDKGSIFKVFFSSTLLSVCFLQHIRNLNMESLNEMIFFKLPY